jgi:hydrogenase/urease accessory protein HupE
VFAWVSLAALSIAALLALPEGAAAHTGTPITVPPEELSPWEAGVEFSKYGVKHILLGYDHLLFLAGLSLLSTGLRDVAAIIGLFALSYSSTLIGGTLLGLAVPGDLVDAVIAISVGYVGAQIAFGAEGRWWLSRNPRAPALVFGLAHGLGLSSLLQELQLPGDDVLPSVLGFNVGVEVGQIAAIAAFIAALRVARAFPFPRREWIPAGCALASTASVLLAFVGLGLDL